MRMHLGKIAIFCALVLPASFLFAEYETPKAPGLRIIAKTQVQVKAIYVAGNDGLIFGQGDNELLEWSRNGALIGDWKSQNGIGAVAVSSTGTCFAMSYLKDGNPGKDVYEFGGRRRILRGSNSPVKAIGLSGDGSVVAVAYENGFVNVWRGDASRPRVFDLRSLQGFNNLAVSEDGALVVAANGDVAVINLQTGKTSKLSIGRDCYAFPTQDDKVIVAEAPESGITLYDSSLNRQISTTSFPGDQVLDSSQAPNQNAVCFFTIGFSGFDVDPRILFTVQEEPLKLVRDDDLAPNCAIGAVAALSDPGAYLDTELLANVDPGSTEGGYAVVEHSAAN